MEPQRDSSLRTAPAYCRQVRNDENIDQTGSSFREVALEHTTLKNPPEALNRI